MIEENLSRAFAVSPLLIEYFEIKDSLSTAQIDRLSYLLFTGPVFLFFLSDNIEYPQVILQCKNIGKFTYLVPIYGNMTIETERWLRLNSILNGEKVILLCASERSTQQVKKLSQEDSTIETLPYPMEVKQLADQRKKDQIIRIVYAGRITTGKNILQLMEVFSKAVKFKSDLELHIAGDFHDRGHHFHGYEVPFTKLKESFYKYVHDSGSKIVYHGQLSEEDLYTLYSQMDVFCSPSTYHDEDFGVSAAQAGLMGLELLLSNWGGHANFPAAKLIHVYVDNLNIPKIDKENLFKSVINLKKLEFKKINAPLKDYLSFKTFNQSLSEIIETQPSFFKGASPIYIEFCQREKNVPPFSIKSLGSKELYLKIYKSYLG